MYKLTRRFPETIEKTVEMDGYKLKLYIIRPSNIIDKPLPVFLFIPSNGSFHQGHACHSSTALELVNLTGHAAIYVIPKMENNDDVYAFQVFAALKWIAAYGHEADIDSHKIAAVGFQCGGHIAAIITLLAAENCWPKVKLQILIWPEFKNNRPLHRINSLAVKTNEWCNLREVYDSPLNVKFHGLSGLPPTLIQKQQNAAHNHEIDYYESKLRDAGSNVDVMFYNCYQENYNPGKPLNPDKNNLLFVHAAAEMKKYLILFLFTI
ncbi:hypothetical protein Dfri01_46480 [Dyadobacter frigoris]|uniref:alpha/beta hydrolase n=1 Tax=Dyadobacter frigoris TaxID=2576211 RepID=UPI0024A33AC7|nr:alpha/beta hydrolase [Dyadobacter frigoris]GLU55187.1 hypothetical protein Dfri01_46480 [Dyadobacter frigoris]